MSNPFIRRVLANRTKPSNWNGEGFLSAEVKYDGHRCTIINDGEKVRAFGRKADINLWPKLSESIINVLAPPGIAIDGEIYVKGSGSQDVKTALNEGRASFVAFDIPFIGWKRNEFRSGLSGFLERDAMIRLHGYEHPESYPFVWSGLTQLLKEDMDFAARREGIEGFVLKASASYGWWKQKPVKTVDAIVTGFKEGDGKHRGSLGALVVSLIGSNGLREIASVGGGFSDFDRMFLWEKRNTLLGQIIEVAYDSVQVGRLRFPRFLRFRDDKSEAECTLEQLKD